MSEAITHRHDRCQGITVHQWKEKNLCLHTRMQPPNNSINNYQPVSLHKLFGAFSYKGLCGAITH